MRFSKSTKRGLTNTGCVCESTKPGSTTLPVQSTSVTFLRFFLNHGSRSASLVDPTETAFPPTQRTAPSGMIPSCLRSAPRHGEVDFHRRVRSCPMLARSTGDCRFALEVETATLPQSSSLHGALSCLNIRHNV